MGANSCKTGGHTSQTYDVKPKSTSPVHNTSQTVIPYTTGDNDRKFDSLRRDATLSSIKTSVSAEPFHNALANKGSVRSRSSVSGGVILSPQGLVSPQPPSDDPPLAFIRKMAAAADNTVKPLDKKPYLRSLISYDLEADASISEESGIRSKSNEAKSSGCTLQWKKGTRLGRGSFGTVWLGLTDSGRLIAVKQVELNSLDIYEAEKEYAKIYQEVTVLKSIRHHNVVRYIGSTFENFTISIFMDYVPGGSLFEILQKFGPLEEQIVQCYSYQLLDAISYLHDNGIVHRDIKSANIMLMPKGIIKIIDFGCARKLAMKLSKSGSSLMKSLKGTPYCMAPEVINESGHGKKSDIWSFGCTVFELLTGKTPWGDREPLAAIYAIGSDGFPIPALPDGKYSFEASEFVGLCLTRDKDKRPSAQAMLKHPFVQMESSVISLPASQHDTNGANNTTNSSDVQALVPTTGRYVPKRILSTVLENGWMGGSSVQSARSVAAASDSDSDNNDTPSTFSKLPTRQTSRESGSDSGMECQTADVPRSTSMAGTGVSSIVLLAPDPHEPLQGQGQQGAKAKRPSRGSKGSSDSKYAPSAVDNSPPGTLVKHHRRKSSGSGGGGDATARSRVTPSPIEMSQVHMSPVSTDTPASGGGTTRRINVGPVWPTEGSGRAGYFDNRQSSATSETRSQTPVSG